MTNPLPTHLAAGAATQLHAPAASERTTSADSSPTELQPLPNAPFENLIASVLDAAYPSHHPVVDGSTESSELSALPSETDALVSTVEIASSDSPSEIPDSLLTSIPFVEPVVAAESTEQNRVRRSDDPEADELGVETEPLFPVNTIDEQAFVGQAFLGQTSPDASVETDRDVPSLAAGKSQVQGATQVSFAATSNDSLHTTPPAPVQGITSASTLEQSSNVGREHGGSRLEAAGANDTAALITEEPTPSSNQPRNSLRSASLTDLHAEGTTTELLDAPQGPSSSVVDDSPQNALADQDGLALNSEPAPQHIAGATTSAAEAAINTTGSRVRSLEAAPSQPESESNAVAVNQQSSEEPATSTPVPHPTNTAADGSTESTHAAASSAAAAGSPTDSNEGSTKRDVRTHQASRAYAAVTDEPATSGSEPTTDDIELADDHDLSIDPTEPIEPTEPTEPIEPTEPTEPTGAFEFTTGDASTGPEAAFHLKQAVPTDVAIVDSSLELSPEAIAGLQPPTSNESTAWSETNVPAPRETVTPDQLPVWMARRGKLLDNPNAPNTPGAAGETEYELRLDPPGVDARIVLAKQNDQLFATIYTSDPVAASELEANLGGLRQALAATGVEFTTVEVRTDAEADASASPSSEDAASGFQQQRQQNGQAQATDASYWPANAREDGEPVTHASEPHAAPGDSRTVDRVA